MVTRGVIKRPRDVVATRSGNAQKVQKVHYDVWLPLLDGDDESVVHDAVYCSLPHENTIFSHGDVVYVAAVDLDFDDLVILGMANKDGL